MATAFVAEHRGQFSVRAMCRCLRIQPNGFYAWLLVPLINWATEDKRQTKMLLNACTDSGKVYGYRKLHDDLLERGESTSMDWAAFLRAHNLEHSMSRRETATTMLLHHQGPRGCGRPR